jgi:hypothetical protein
LAMATAMGMIYLVTTYFHYPCSRIHVCIYNSIKYTLLFNKVVLLITFAPSLVVWSSSMPPSRVSSHHMEDFFCLAELRYVGSNENRTCQTRFYWFWFAVLPSPIVRFRFAVRRNVSENQTEPNFGIPINKLNDFVGLLLCHTSSRPIVF